MLIIGTHTMHVYARDHKFAPTATNPKGWENSQGPLLMIAAVTSSTLPLSLLWTTYQ